MLFVLSCSDVLNLYCLCADIELTVDCVCAVWTGSLAHSGSWDLGPYVDLHCKHI
jgi:hypothetical protein